MINNYESDVFLASKTRSETVYLPGIGRFCKCGCNKRIEGTIVKRRIGDNISTYFRPAPKNKVFASIYCKYRFESKKGAHNSKTSLGCKMSLIVNFDKEPYRILSVYLKKGTKIELKITKSVGELWNVCENMSKCRNLKQFHSINTGHKQKEMIAIEQKTI